jgi:hypothetical protein
LKTGVSNEPNADLSWSFDLPDKLKLAIADCITLYSRSGLASLRLSGLWKTPRSNVKRRLQGAGAARIFVLSSALLNRSPALKATKSGGTLNSWIAMKGSARSILTGSALIILERGRVLLNTFAEFKRMLSEGIEEEEARRRAQEGE